jgi:DNA-binding ferritin-like protein
MNKQVQTPEELAGNRIDESAERVKQATSQAVASTKDAVDRAADSVEDGLHRATDRPGRSWPRSL